MIENVVIICGVNHIRPRNLPLIFVIWVQPRLYGYGRAPIIELQKQIYNRGFVLTHSQSSLMLFHFTGLNFGILIKLRNAVLDIKIQLFKL